MGLSIIISHFNEEHEFVMTCLNQLQSTIGKTEYEIILVDDCSKKPFVCEGVKVIRHDKNKGVGACFDTGVRQAKYDNIILMACDVRFDQQDWGALMLNEINNHPKSLICTTCVNEVTGNKFTGAETLLYHDRKTDPKRSHTFRSIIQAKWLPVKKEKTYEIPCILGAFYGVKKEWYNYIDGFTGHKIWGALEPYISLKSWLFGGSCRITREVETLHIFTRSNDVKTRQIYMNYNKAFVAKVLFDDDLSNRLLRFARFGQDIWQLITKEMLLISNKRKEYKEKTVLDFKEYCKRWKVDLR
jgi:glycosyltransferase involved in cell wall biosynthesis